MVDVLTPEQRRLNMSRIRGRDTRPEMLLRRGLHAHGFRFRLHARDLPGRPDLVFPRYRATLLVHGCFWHGHGCPMCRPPSIRPHFWAAKIAENRARDHRTARALADMGWRVFTVWECSVRGPARQPLDAVLNLCAAFIKSNRQHAELAGGGYSSASPSLSDCQVQSKSDKAEHD